MEQLQEKNAAEPKVETMKPQQPGVNPQTTQLSPEEAAERAERVQKLVAGRIAPPNQVVGYMVDQLRKVLQESEGLSNQLQQWESRAAQARNRLGELRGMRNKYIEDIEAFDKPPAKKQPPTESAEGEKAEVAA